MTKKSTKRALLSSVMALFLCLTMLLGTTFAWFTDTASSSGNKIVAGNLDVELCHTNGTDTDEPVSNHTTLFDEVALWEPGAMVWEKLTVKNLGSLALKYVLSVNVTDISTLPDGKSLADVLKVAVLTEQPTPDNIPAAATQDLATFNLASDKELMSGDSDEFYVAIYWAPSSNDNDYNVAGEELYANLGVTLLATQYTYESDSFNDQYDKDADYAVSVGTAADLVRALKSDGKIILTNDITITAADLTNDPNLASIPVGLAVVGTTATLDLNGNDITIEAQDGAAIHVKDGNLTIVGDGTISNTGTSGYVVWAKGSSTVNVQDGAFFAGGDDTTLFYASGTVAYDPNSDWATINIYGGTFTNGAVGDSVQDYLNVMNHGVGRINIYGGTFDFDPANTAWGDDKAYIKVAPTYEVVDNGDGTYTIVRSKVVNFTEDMSEELVIGDNDEMTLNLGDKALNNTLTNNGDVTVNNGTISTPNTATGAAAVGFQNYGDATLNNVSMNTGSASDYGNILYAGSTTEYNDVEITSKGGGIGVTDGAKATFNSGSVYVDSASTSGRYLFYVVGDGSELTINDGSFSWDSADNQKRAYVYVGSGATVYITGGTFGAASTRSGYTDGILGEGTVEITGGTFGFNPSTWVADGYVAVESNGVWTVSAK